MMSLSRVESSLRDDSRRAISSLQSGMFCLRNPVYCLHKCLPTTSLRGQNLLALGCQAVITSAALAVLFHPSALNPPAFLQAIEQWIEGGHIEADSPAGALLDDFGNLVAVSWPGLDERQDQKLRTDLLPFKFRHRASHIWRIHIIATLNTKVNFHVTRSTPRYVAAS